MHTTIDRPVFDDRDLFDRALKIYLRRAQPELGQWSCLDQPGYSASGMEGSTYYLRNVNGTLARFRVNASGHLSFAGWGKGRTGSD